MDAYGVEHNNHGYDGKVEQYCCLEWQIVEELCVQWVSVALAQEFGIKEAIEIFPRVFFEGTLPFENQ